MKGETAPSACWITWEIQTRNRSISKLIGADLYELISNRTRVIRYVVLINKTIRICKSYQIIYAQNPSIVLAFLVVAIGAFTKKTIIIDAHNSGVFPLEGKSSILNHITRLICKSADSVIVTNHALAEEVASYGGNPFILPDPIPHLSIKNGVSTNNYGSYVFFICTWASDEPYLEVIEAAKKIPTEIKILISGKYSKKIDSTTKDHLPENVVLLGFVDEAEYKTLLANALVSIDLTTRENCLVCGAYESAALSTPCIVSESEVNKQIFHTGFIYSKPDRENIANAINFALENRQKLAHEIRSFSKAHTELIDVKIEELKKLAASRLGD